MKEISIFRVKGDMNWGVLLARNQGKEIEDSHPFFNSRFDLVKRASGANEIS